ncbi:unnamed protein product [Symbiodinium natans]|uniref:Ubiquitin-like domain-containing protein n=1 Tax=Symbiodinium natans TaxID=878477 RepID=A0A812HMW5_9DINO|nr:unnamed protein product [Symbiodinium natans]
MASSAYPTPVSDVADAQGEVLPLVQGESNEGNSSDGSESVHSSDFGSEKSDDEGVTKGSGDDPSPVGKKHEDDDDDKTTGGATSSAGEVSVKKLLFDDLDESYKLEMKKQSYEQLQEHLASVLATNKEIVLKQKFISDLMRTLKNEEKKKMTKEEKQKKMDEQKREREKLRNQSLTLHISFNNVITKVTLKGSHTLRDLREKFSEQAGMTKKHAKRVLFRMGNEVMNDHARRTMAGWKVRNDDVIIASVSGQGGMAKRGRGDLFDYDLNECPVKPEHQQLFEKVFATSKVIAEMKEPNPEDIIKLIGKDDLKELVDDLSSSRNRTQGKLLTIGDKVPDIQEINKLIAMLTYTCDRFKRLFGKSLYHYGKMGEKFDMSIVIGLLKSNLKGSVPDASMNS